MRPPLHFVLAAIPGSGDLSFQVRTLTVVGRRGSDVRELPVLAELAPDAVIGEASVAPLHAGAARYDRSRGRLVP